MVAIDAVKNCTRSEEEPRGYQGLHRVRQQIDSKALVCQHCHTWQVEASHEGRLEGTARVADEREATVRLVLDRVGNDWKVSGFQIRPR